MRRRTAKTLSVAALAGGLTLGSGLVGSTATAMPTLDMPMSAPGQLCQQAVAGTGWAGGGPRSAIEGLPGLRCGQVLGLGTQPVTDEPVTEEPVTEEPVAVESVDTDDTAADDAGGEFAGGDVAGGDDGYRVASRGSHPGPKTGNHPSHKRGWHPSRHAGR